MIPDSLQMRAPAKINLFLHVTGKQADNRHAVQSLVCFADVADDVYLSTHDSLYIDVEGPFADQLGDVRENLVYKAAMLLAESYGVAPRARIVLTKNLPVAAGIGGGSSDAAQTLKGLARLWKLPEDWQRLESIARKIGADVPACLYRKTAWTEGAGEKITVVDDVPNLHLLLVNPGVPTPTAQVFKQHRPPFSPPLIFTGRRKSAAAWLSDLQFYRNDLTDAAMAVTPQIRDVLAAIAGTKNCLLHRLSGSGATCFGLYANENDAAAAARLVQNAKPGWWVSTAGMLK